MINFSDLVQRGANAYYAGIGSRETPSDICQLMTGLAISLDKSGLILRSGGAKGADQAFELGAQKKNIYLPWAKFENNNSTLYSISKEAYELAENFHPAWNRLSNGAKRLHARNVYQVLGSDCKTPSIFVITWTKDGLASGGTGQALRIAESHQIPIFNLFDEQVKQQLVDWNNAYTNLHSL